MPAKPLIEQPHAITEGTPIKKSRWELPQQLFTSSPGKLKARTFRAEFKLPDLRKEVNGVEPTPTRRYQNPVILAQDWQQALANECHVSPAAIARHLGVSRARVTQVLRLLRLTPKGRKTIAALGDPLPAPVVTERRLRPIIDLPAHEQLQEIQAIIAKG